MSYLLGSIHFGLVFAKVLTGKDLRDLGSGNIGATNAFRTGNKWVGILTYVFDVLKGFAPFFVASFLGFSPDEALIIGVFSPLGHMFSIFLKFKGGKGVASTLGLLLAFQPWIGIILFALWSIVFAAFKISGMASVSSACILPFLVFYGSSGDKVTMLVFISLSVLILIKHKSNIFDFLQREK